MEEEKRDWAVPGNEKGIDTSVVFQRQHRVSLLLDGFLLIISQERSWRKA